MSAKDTMDAEATLGLHFQQEGPMIVHRYVRDLNLHAMEMDRPLDIVHYVIAKVKLNFDYSIPLHYIQR